MSNTKDYVERIISTIDDGGTTFAINRNPNDTWTFLVISNNGFTVIDDCFKTKSEAFAAYYEQLSCDHLSEDLIEEDAKGNRYRETEAERVVAILVAQQAYWKSYQSK